MKKKSKVSILVLIFLLITVFYPLVEMLLRVEWSDFGNLIASRSFKEALSNSLFVTSISTIISILIAYLLAYTLNRTNIKHRAVLKVLLTIPMLIPSISHGLGLINLFGANGIISKILGFNIIGCPGIIIGSILYSFPVAFLMLDDGFNYIDNNMYNTAKVLGLNQWQTFKKVTLCYLKKPLLSSIFAVFTMIFTDYGVPLAVGGKFLTLPVFLYKEVIGLLDFSKGTMIGLFLLVPAIISFLFDNFSKDYSSGEFEGKDYKISKNKTRDIIFTTLLYLIIIFVFVVIGSFVYYAFIDNFIINKSFSLKHFEYVLSNDIGKYILPVRQQLLRILELSGRPMTPKSLSLRLGVSPSSVQHHLKQLLPLGVVKVDHQERINGIVATYYACTGATVCIGATRADLRNDREALAFQVVQTAVQGYFETMHRLGPTMPEEGGDAMAGVLHLTEADWLAFRTQVKAFFDAHSLPGPDTSPWEFALLAYDASESSEVSP